MSRGRSPDEPGFGSDSFLDIIANLVGILIILIVLAGLRASETVELAETARQAAEETDAAAEPGGDSAVTAAEAEEHQPDSGLPAPPDVETRRQVAAQREAELKARQEMEAERQRRLAAIDEAARLGALSDLMKRQLSELESAARELDDDARSTLASAVAERDNFETAARVLIATRNRLEQEHAEAVARIGNQSKQLRELGTELKQVNEILARLIEEEPAKKTLSHHVSPVGRVVYGDEVHFRISAGMISHVPVEELTEILRDNIRQNGSWLIKYNRHAGQVGPVEGYQLDYVVARQPMSPVDELRSGRGMVRISLSQFIIRPLPGLEEEQVARSIREGGLVYRQLATRPPGSPVTLWVYPDSFAEYREVAAFAQRNGFIVAGRPLPKGMPISGSPHGSKSVAQ